MRKYTFEIVMEEGNDEFWEGLEGTGCDEIQETLQTLLEDEGWPTVKVSLKKFEDN